MKKSISIFVVLSLCLLILSGCSFSIDIGNNSKQTEQTPASISDALSSFADEEVIRYIESHYTPGEIYENVTDISTTTWDEISGDELCDRNGEVLWEYVERVLRENEEEQRRIAEEMAPYIEATPAQNHNVPTVNSSSKEKPEDILQQMREKYDIDTGIIRTDIISTNEAYASGNG